MKMRLHTPPILLAIDPGSEQSAMLLYGRKDRRPIAHAIQPNETLLQALREGKVASVFDTEMAIEMMRPRGMPTSYQEMLTCVWIGRFLEAWGGAHAFVFRTDVKVAICGRASANDSNVRAALLDAWGGKDLAVGKKGARGPLYGIANDVWSALAIAVTRAHQLGDPIKWG